MLDESGMTETQTLLSSKFWRTLLTLVSVILIFAGPTYGIYALAVLLKVNLAVSVATGFVLFAVGMMLMWYLMKNKVIE